LRIGCFITRATSTTPESFASLSRLLDELEQGGAVQPDLLPGHRAAAL
jgi:hypothetical protein